MAAESEFEALIRRCWNGHVSVLLLAETLKWSPTQVAMWIDSLRLSGGRKLQREPANVVSVQDLAIAVLRDKFTVDPDA